MRKILLKILLVLALTIVACSNGDDWWGEGPNVAAAPDQTTFDVTWKQATKVIAQSDARDRLVSYEPAQGTYTFSSDADAIAALKPGDIVVLTGVGLVNVTKVDDQGTQIVLHADPAALTDAVEDGNIAWDVGFDFTRPHRFLTLDIDNGKYTLALKQSPPNNRTSALTATLSYSGKVAGYDVSLSLTPDGKDGVSVKFKAKRKWGGNAVFSFSGTGTLRGFRVTGGVNVEVGSTKEVHFETTDVEGDFTIEYGGVEIGTGSNAFKIPAKLVMPFMLGPIPANVSIGGALEMTASLKERNSVLAKAHIKFKGNIGLESDGKSIAPRGSLTRSSLTFEHGDSVATLTSGLGVLLQFPRVEFGLGLPGIGAAIYSTVKNEVIANTTVHFEAAGNYPVITGTCLEVNVNVGAYVGGELKLLGMKVASKETPVFTKLMPKKRIGESCKK